MKLKFIQSSRDFLGGTPVFTGTRVPVQALIDYIEAGDSVNDFFHDFPSVSRKQITGILEYVKQKVLVK